MARKSAAKPDLKLTFDRGFDENRRRLAWSMHETAEYMAEDDLEIEVAHSHVLRLVAGKYPKIMLLLFMYFARTLARRGTTTDDDRFFTLPPDLLEQIPAFFGTQLWPPGPEHWILCFLAARSHFESLRFRIADGG